MRNMSDGVEVTVPAPDKFKIFILATANVPLNYKIPNNVQFIFFTATGSYLARLSKEDPNNLGNPLYVAELVDDGNPLGSDTGAEINPGEYNIDKGSNNFVSLSGLSDGVIVSMTMYS